MSIPPKEQKFRISLSKKDLCLFQSYLSKDLDNIIENAPLLADVQKAIRKIEFQVLEPSHSASPKALSHSFDKVIEKAKDMVASQAFLAYTEGVTLTEEQTLLAIRFKAELGEVLTDLEKKVLNEEMIKKLRF